MWVHIYLSIYLSIYQSIYLFMFVLLFLHILLSLNLLTYQSLCLCHSINFNIFNIVFCSTNTFCLFSFLLFNSYLFFFPLLLPRSFRLGFVLPILVGISCVILCVHFIYTGWPKSHLPFFKYIFHN